MKKSLSISVVSYGGKGWKLFDYFDIQDTHVAVGSIVKVGFGKRESLGVVVRTNHTPPEGVALQTIISVLSAPPLPSQLLSLAEWLCDYYSASQQAVWRTILPSGLHQKSQLKASGTVPMQEVAGITPNTDQAAAVAEIIQGKKRGYLLHGITGSGKTEVYIQLIKHMLCHNLSCMLLVPEISLTPQIIERLGEHFPADLIINHSKLTPARRKQAWLEVANSNKPKVIIGPRSSLFLPVKALGLVIVDEEHEQSYKQENSPCYNTNQVVAKLCELHNAHYVLGSATPSLTSYQMAKIGMLGYIQLTQRAGEGKLPPVLVVDRRDRHELLLPELITAMKKTLIRGDQVLLFLNRRGSAGALVCNHCGESVLCPNCAMSLTFHGDIARLMCHYCGFKQLPPNACPSCQAEELNFVGSGTKRVEEKINSLFASYKIARLDSDNADLETITNTYQRLKRREIDIIIGTQMIARGLDLSGIGLVGVIATEGMLAIPDFSSSERTFQLLTQVSGRSGRSNDTGQVIIQTLSPNHPAIQAASEHNFLAFYQHEILQRQHYAYPPFIYLVKLMYGHARAEIALRHSAEVAEEIKQAWPALIVLGPIERSLRRSGGKYWQQLIIKSKRRAVLLDIIADLKPGWKHDIDPTNMS